MAFDTILIVGCGNMAGAMLRRWIVEFGTRRFTIVDPVNSEFASGIPTHTEVPANGRFDAILLGIKPQALGEVAPQIEPLAGPDTAVISMLAGVELGVLAERFPRARGLLRIVPNLSAELGKSPIAMTERGLGADGRQAAVELMKPLGSPEWVDEAHFDLITALAGSGPAFVYRFIDALGTAAAELGLPEETSWRMALAMVEGASALAATSPDSPAELARRVTSPGGTTQAGLAVLDDGDALRVLIEKTLRAARDRSAELGAEARRKG